MYVIRNLLLKFFLILKNFINLSFFNIKKIYNEGIKNFYLGNKYNLSILNDLKINGGKSDFSLHKLSKDKIFSFEIIQFGRFSNLILALSRCMMLAKKWRVQNIYLPENCIVRQLIPNGNLISSKDNSLNIIIGKASKGIVLKGNFFYNKDMNVQMSNSDYSNMIDIFRERTEIKPKINKVSESKLTIHIRSGDIFEKKHPHPWYGQPPLSFYQEAITHYKPESVDLVFENKKNPVIDKLIDFLEENNIFFTIYSSNSLREDIQILVNAKALVIGNGNFLIGVIPFANYLETVYTFNIKLRTFVLSNEAIRKLNNYVSRDITGIYKKKLLRKNWKNTIKQRNLMLTYDRKNLALCRK